MLRTRAALFIASATALALFMAACSEGPSATPTTTTAAVDGATPDEGQPDRANFDFGNRVIIEDSRVVPLRLGASIDGDIEFVNASATEVTIRFIASLDDSNRLDSGPIPPGGTFKVRPLYIGQFTYTVGPEPLRTGGIEVHTVEGLKNERGT